MQTQVEPEDGILNIDYAADDLECLLHEARRDNPTDRSLFKRSKKKLSLALKFVEWLEMERCDFVFTKSCLYECDLFHNDEKAGRKTLKFLLKIDAVKPVTEQHCPASWDWYRLTLPHMRK